MRKKLIYIALLMVLLTSCEQYYNPDIEEVPTMMVVESHITNDPNQNYVKLTRALNFYSSEQQTKIVGAKVILIEETGTSFTGIESGTGYFTFARIPVPGKKYMLRITHQKDIYESDQVIMPPLPRIDTLYTNHRVEKTYQVDAFGGLMHIETPGRDICIDAPINASLKYYRFNWRAIIQWIYQAPIPPGAMPSPPIFGWKSFYDNGIFNITGSKQFSVSDKVKNHPILFLGYDSRAYLDSSTLVPQGWIVIINQYGIPKESYDFHEKLNKQFTADGSLFDPIQTQVYGNIRCRSDSKKIVAGFFDLNSYRQYRYYVYLGTNQNSTINQRRLNRYLEIPDNGSLVGTIPAFWEKYN